MGVANIMLCSSVTLALTLSKYASLASRSFFYRDVMSLYCLEELYYTSYILETNATEPLHMPCHAHHTTYSCFGGQSLGLDLYLFTLHMHKYKM